MTVWLVVVGDYSDSRTIGAFSTEERAEAASAIWNGYVEAFEVDALDPLRWRIAAGDRLWRGYVSRAGAIELLRPGSLPEKMPSPAMLPRNGVRLVFECLARDEERARKIAGEIRSEWLRDPVRLALWEDAIAAEQVAEQERAERGRLESARNRAAVLMMKSETFALRMEKPRPDWGDLRAEFAAARTEAEIERVYQEALRRSGWLPPDPRR